jgi:hypothetical protein
MLKRLIAGLLSLVLIIAIQSAPANSTVKAGSACKKVGTKSTVGKITFTCIKSGKKLIWNKGIIGTISKPSGDVTVESKYELTPAVSFNDISTCRLNQNYQNFFNTGFGFPRSDVRLKNTGSVKGILVFVEFSDIKGLDDPELTGKRFSDNFIKFYENMSYNKLKFDVDIHPKYISIEKDSGSYGMNVWNSGNPWQYLSDGLTAADPFIDFKPYEFVIFIPPTLIEKIVYGPAFPLPPGDMRGYTSEKIITNGSVGGSDWRTRRGTEWIWLAHEVGHLLGMEHQYLSTSGKFPVWDLMYSMDSYAPSLFAWHRFLQGWFDKDQVACTDKEYFSNKSMTVNLSGINNLDKNTKSMMIKLNEKEILVIEARTRSSFDVLEKNHEGLLVYIVDVTKKSNEGAFTLLTNKFPDEKNHYLIGSIPPGSAVDFGSIEIVNLERSSNGFIVQIRNR